MSGTDKRLLVDTNILLYLDKAAAIKQTAIKIKQQRKIKIPDAIIAATAIVHDIPLCTSDKAFSKVSGIRCLIFEV